MPELDIFLKEIEDRQMQTEREVYPGRSDEELSLIKQKRKRIFDIINNIESSAEEDNSVLEELRNYTIGLDKESIDRFRQDISNFPITFTMLEEPALVFTLAASFARVYKFVQKEVEGAHFIIATDCVYRPHASIRKLSSECYLILLGRYLILDLPRLADVMAEAFAQLQPSLGKNPWSHKSFGSTLSAFMASSELKWRWSYLLCASAEGERYRLATPFPTDPYVAEIGHELLFGALDFIVAHELAHVGLGHLEPQSRPISEIPDHVNTAATRLNSTSGRNAASLIQNYSTECWPHHQLELVADCQGVLMAGGTGPTGAWDLRLIGAQMAIGMIAFLDRTSHLFKHHGEDPAVMVGLDNYNFPFFVDLVLPKTSPPWGETRERLLRDYLSCHSNDFSRIELLRKMQMLEIIQNVFFGACERWAIFAMEWVNSMPGEFCGVLIGDEKLRTLHWSDPNNPENYEEFVSKPSQLYADLRGGEFHHGEGFSILASAYEALEQHQATLEA